MLAHWFNRSGIGQLLAPDENAPKVTIEEEAKSGGILQLLAPDPNFALPPPPPPQVQCQHCHKWTTVEQENMRTFDRPDPSGASCKKVSSARPPTTPLQQDSSSRQGSQTTMTTPFFTPTPKRRYRRNASPSSQQPPQQEHLLASPELQQYVLSAAQNTAEAIVSPPLLQKQRDKVFRTCAAKDDLKGNLAKRLRNFLTKDPSLLHARATHLGDLAPDGLTPLQTTAYSGALWAMEIILEVAQKTDIIQEQALLLETDLKGRTALHIAAERGHLDIVQKLLPFYQVGPANNNNNTLTSPMPVDLLGRTPFGSAITSPNPTARKNKKELEQVLYSRNDLSVLGEGAPSHERIGYDSILQVQYGTADMPGRRVTMEDAICHVRFQVHSESFLLLGVCDGHGDLGLVSDFVAMKVPLVLQEQLQLQQGQLPRDWAALWKATCLQVDEQLKAKGDAGGSTAVFCLFTEKELVVANVGDSRIILVQEQQQPLEIEDLEASVEQLSLSEEKPSSDASTLTTKATSGHVVVPLSEDHKPNLPGEQARIEAAGLRVEEITFEENETTITIPKVAKSDSDMLAVSRAFGDFEYKGNTTLGPEEQAVVCLPEVLVHERCASDQYLVLACDGIWDVCSNEMVKDFVIDQITNRLDRQNASSSSDAILPEVGDALLLESLHLGSQDNMSTIVVAVGSATQTLDQRADVSATTSKTLNFDSQA